VDKWVFFQLYEEVLKENQGLKGRLSHAEQDIADMKAKLDKITLVSDWNMCICFDHMR